MTETYQPRGMYFEDFEIGNRVTTAARTITEGDIVAFAGLSGDYNQIHTDAEYAKSTPYGQRIAHGLLVLSIASGLIAQSGVLDGTVLAFREISNWKFTKPTFIGDTIQVITKITAVKAMRRLGGGVVDLELSVHNQDDEVVMKGVWRALMVGKPATAE